MSRELSLGDVKALFKIWRKLVEFEPDIVHTHTAKAGTLGRVAAFLYKWMTPATLIGRPRRLRVFHTFHGHIFHGYYSSSKTGLFLFIEKILARFATGTIIVISKQQAVEIGETYKVADPKKIEIVPLGLDISAFEESASEGDRFRAEFGINKNEVLVGIVGRLTEIKNHPLFIDAVRSSDFPQARFVIVGDGHLRQELETLAKGTGIVFAGNRTDPNAFYSAIDIVALTSLNEGTPLTLIEAMAFGKPWVAAAVGGVVDLAGTRISSKFQVQSSKLESGEVKPDSLNFEQCERGVLFESEDVRGLVEGLKLLLGNPELRTGMGVNGKSFVSDNYSKERLVKDISDLYGL